MLSLEMMCFGYEIRCSRRFLSRHRYKLCRFFSSLLSYIGAIISSFFANDTNRQVSQMIEKEINSCHSFIRGICVEEISSREFPA